jgi:ribose transport system permease protein
MTTGTSGVPLREGLIARLRSFLPAKGILLANVGLVAVALALLNVNLFSRASLSTLTPVVGTMVLVALGQAFIIGTGGIDLSVPSTVTLCGVIVLKSSDGKDGNLAGSLIITLLVCLGIGLVNGFLVEVTKLDALVVTLATGQLIAGFTRIYHGQTLAVSEVPPALTKFSRHSWGDFSVMLLLAVGVGIVVALWLKFHTSGRRLAASSVAPRAAEVSGLAATRQRITAWMIGTFLVGVGSILLAGQVSTPDLSLGDDYLLTPIVAVVIGGALLTGSRVKVAGATLGGLFLIVLEHVFRVRGYSSGLATAVEGVVLAVGLALVTVTRDLTGGIRWRSILAFAEGRASRSPAGRSTEQENEE